MTVTTQIEGDIANVIIENPPVNATSQKVRQGLLDAVEEVAGSTVKVVILSCAGRTFVAGADIREFGAPPALPHLPDVLNAIEASPVPWVAAIHGTALGGGLELCLACAYRIANKSAKMGLPEVTLGLIPGAGGTVRLPRLIAPKEALTMIAGGRPISAQKALSVGLIDALVDNLQTGMEDLAREVAGQSAPVPLSQRMAPTIDEVFESALAKTKARAKGQNAIVAAADAVERSLHQSAHDAFKAERAAFLELKSDPQSTALRHVFFAERSVGKLQQTKDINPRPLAHIGVIGGGTMGSGISAACLLAGLDVTMVERDADAARVGVGRVADVLEGAVKRGKLPRDGRDAALGRFSAASDYDILGDADLVIEAVFEDMEVKKQVFVSLDAVVRPDAILASNTSYLDVAVLAAFTEHPERVIGLHFFSPAHVMKLLEVIVPQSASPATVATGMMLGKLLGKISVPSGVCDGFIGNRIMSAYRREADYMIVDGALPHEVDAAMRDFGFPIGVFQMQDLAGLDIAWAMRKRKAVTRDPSERYVTVADQLCGMGRFGRKTGRGWYDYRNDPNGQIDPSVTQIITDESKKAGVSREPISADDIMTRIVGIMQAEGEAILAEGIAETSEAIDVVMINGYGFPRWRGGPMFMKDQRN